MQLTDLVQASAHRMCELLNKRTTETFYPIGGDERNGLVPVKVVDSDSSHYELRNKLSINGTPKPLELTPSDKNIRSLWQLMKNLAETGADPKKLYTTFDEQGLITIRKDEPEKGQSPRAELLIQDEGLAMIPYEKETPLGFWGQVENVNWLLEGLKASTLSTN